MIAKKLKSLVSALLVATLLVTLVACGGTSSAEKKTGGEINLMTWGGDFIPRETIESFEKETGIKINYKEVTSNEDMLSLLEANSDQYDLAVVTDYMVEIMVKNDHLAKLDKTQLPNFSNIKPVYQGNYYDVNNEYSVPYAVSSAFLLVNPAAVEALGAAPITGFGDLWQPELENKVVIVDWSVEVIGFTLKALGYEFNETDPAIVEEAREKLFALRKNIVRFETNTPEDSLINGEAVAGYVYSNQAAKGKALDDALEPVFPTEGMPIFIDSFVMSKEAPNKEAAHQFLNYLLDPKVSANNSAITSFINANAAATEFLPEDFKNNVMLNIPDEVIENTSFYIDVDKVLEEYDHIYSEFKMK